MERKTFPIMFFIKRTKLKKNQEALIILRITVKRERADISIQRSINQEQWNSAKGGAEPANRYGKDLNEYLYQLYLKLYKCNQEAGRLVFKM